MQDLLHQGMRGSIVQRFNGFAMPHMQPTCPRTVKKPMHTIHVCPVFKANGAFG
jgi:hypothetical protein